MARVYQKTCRSTNPSEAVGYQNFASGHLYLLAFFITFAVAVTATMLFVFNISNIVIYSFFVTSCNSVSNVSSSSACTLNKYL